MKKSIKKLIKKLPIDFTKNQKYDSLTFKIMQIVLEGDSTFVDVGCHKGEVLEQALLLSPEGKHYGFEPIPEYAKLLQSKFDDRCEIVEVGLGKERGTSTFQFVKSNPAYSGLKRRSYPGKEEIQEITIDIDTLDNKLHNADRIDLIKIDVEGAELEVLKGAEKTIRKHNPVVVFEFGLGAADYYGVSSEDIWKYFDSLGYNLYTMKGFVERKSALREDAFNRLYKKNTEYYFVARFRF